MIKKITFWIWLMWFTAYASAQTDSLWMWDNVLDNIEDYLEQFDSGEEFSSEEFIESLEERGEGLPNLNALRYETAIQLLHITDYQYYQLQLYIEEYGQLVSIFELPAIPGFGREEMERLHDRVKVEAVLEQSSFFKNFFQDSHNSLLIRYGQVLEQQAGYDTSRSNHYEGTPGHACFRYTFKSKDKIFLKFSGEKDAGESFFRKKQKYGFDFYSGSLSVKNLGIIQAAVVGDYRLNFGQGLVMGSSLLSGKGSGVDAIRRFGDGIRAVAPTNEGDFLRGGAITMGNTQWSGTLFGGRRFRTLENGFGAELLYRQNGWRVGLRAVLHTTSDTTLDNSGTRLLYAFTPDEFNIAADYQVIVRRMLLFGEAAIDRHGHLGVIQCAQLQPLPKIGLGVVLRHYDNGFYAPWGNAFGASSHNNAETGIYITADIILGKNTMLTLFTDYYLFNWTTYRAEAPIQCMDFGGKATVQLSRNHQLTLRYTFRSRPENYLDDLHYKSLQECLRHKARAQWQCKPHPKIVLKTVMEWQLNHYPMSQANFQGVLLYQNIALQWKKPEISVHLRLAYFDTDRYDERLYAYEDDVYYTFTVGSYYYKGVRGYVVLRYKYKWFSIWLRIAQTLYLDREVISSGLTQIDKPHKTEVKAQVVCNW